MRDSLYYYIVYSSNFTCRADDELFLHTLFRVQCTHIVYMYLSCRRRGAFLGVGEKTARFIDKKKIKKPSASLLCGLSLWSFGNLIGFHFSKISPPEQLSHPVWSDPLSRRSRTEPSYYVHDIYIYIYTAYDYLPICRI